MIWDGACYSSIRRAEQTANDSRASGGATVQLGSPVVSGTVIATVTPIPLSYQANVSAYCLCELCCGKWSDGITASGHVIQAGDRFVAAPPGIPFGTLIGVPGYGLIPVLDRGGAITGNRLDVYFPDHDSAMAFGRQYLTVTIQGTIE